MSIIKIQKRGVITLPKEMRERLKIKDGSALMVRDGNGSIILEPHRSTDDAILSDIKQGLEEIKRGEYIEFSSIPELHEKVKKYVD